MGLVRTVTERVAVALLSLVATAMATGGLALAGLGATLRQTDFDMDGLPIITGGLMALGGVLAVPGVVAVVWTRLSGYSSGRVAPSPGGSSIVLLVVAAGIPLALATQLGPLVGYWRDVMRLAVEYEVWDSFNGPSGLVFVPLAGVLLVPGIEAAAAGVVALSCGLLILLVAIRSAAAPRLVAVGTILVSGLVAGSWIGVSTTERLAPAVEQLIRTTPDPGGQEQARALALLVRHRDVNSGSVWTLSWAGAAMVLLAFAARTSPGSDAVQEEPIAPALHGLDDASRAEALLDAADRLHRTTPPVRRF